MKLPEMTDARRRNLLIILAVMFLAGLWIVMDNRNEPVKVLYYPTFKSLIAEKKLAEVNIVDRGLLYGKIRAGVEVTINEPGKPVTKLKAGAVVTTPTPDDRKLLELLEASGTKYTYVLESGGFLSSPMFSLLLTVGFFVLIFWYLSRQANKAMNGQHKEADKYTKSNAQLVSDTKATFDDVAGIDEAKQELQFAVDFLKDPDKYTRLGGKFQRGILLVGAPGTGKTLLARAVAGEAGVPFYSIVGTQFVQMFVGVGAARVRDLFAEAKKHKSCIIFIDEIDAVGQTRGVGNGLNNDEREQTLLQLLAEMDGFDEKSGILVLAATNRPERLDAALLRPGRFDTRVELSKPDVEGRIAILTVHTKNKPLQNDDIIRTIAEETSDMTGADLENVATKAANRAARLGKEKVELEDFENSVDEVLMGKELKSRKEIASEKRLKAYHEAGHALVGKILAKGGGFPNIVRKVTIVSRPNFGGVTVFTPTDEITIAQKTHLMAMIAVAHGGHLAETMILGEMSSGASNDIQRATAIARTMVTKLGMSELLGPICFDQSETQQYLNRPMNFGEDNLSNEEKAAIGKEVRRIVDESIKLATGCLERYRPALEKTAELLIKKETISGAEMDPFIDECEKSTE